MNENLYKVISKFSPKPNEKGVIYYQYTILFADGRTCIVRSTNNIDSTEISTGHMYVTFEPRLDFKTNAIVGVTPLFYKK